MRIYLGHKLPLGLYGGVGFGGYHATHVRHQDGEDVPLSTVKLGTGSLGWFLFFALVIYCFLKGC